MADKRLRGTAHHEAGHAIIGWLCDHVVGEVTIRPDREAGYLGLAHLHEEGCNDLFKPFTMTPHPNDPEVWLVHTSARTARPLTEDERHWLELHDRLFMGNQNERQLIPLVAGMVAEQKFSPGTFDPRSGDADYEIAGECLWRLSDESGTPVDELWAQMAARVGELLDDPLVGRVVTRLARALLRKETMSGEDVTRVIRRVVTGPSWSPRPGRSRTRPAVWNPTKDVAEAPRPRVGRPRGGRKRA